MNRTIIKADDYFRYNAPFRQWLYNNKGTQLSDYKTDQAKEIFANEFVLQWNKKELDKEFYEKGSNFKTDFSKKPVDNVRVRNSDNFGFTKQEESRLFSHKPETKQVDPSLYKDKNVDTKISDKMYLKRKAEDLEELVPKKEGNAKLVESRRLKSSHTRHENQQTLISLTINYSQEPLRLDQLVLQMTTPPSCSKKKTASLVKNNAFKIARRRNKGKYKKRWINTIKGKEKYRKC